MDNKINIVNKVIKVIKKNGIKKYINNFDFKFDFDKEDDDDKFYKKLNIFVKKYHHHTFFMKTRIINNEIIISHKNSKIWRKLPDFELKNNIGIIKFYKFIMISCDNSNPIDKKDKDKIVEVVTNILDDWLNNKKIKGLIIDFTEHSGGAFAPIALCFGKYFDTLFRFYQNTSTKWLTVVKDNIVDIKYKSNNNYFPVPIAIIIDKHTASSGEIGASMFYNKPNIKFFGQPTCGALSINQGYKINKYLEIMLTVTLLQTTDKKIHYDEKLYPDVVTNNPIKDAIKWITNLKTIK